MYDGSPEERKQLQRDFLEKGTFNVLITHYDLVMRDKSALKKVVACCNASECFGMPFITLVHVLLPVYANMYSKRLALINITVHAYRASAILANAACMMD